MFGLFQVHIDHYQFDTLLYVSDCKAKLERKALDIFPMLAEESYPEDYRGLLSEDTEDEVADDGSVYYVVRTLEVI